jgi:tetratricopeptide (TPR) repeat protein
MIQLEARFSRAFPAALLTAACVLLACGGTRAQTPEELLQQGDAFATKLETKQALQCYLEFEKQQPDNADVLVRIARQYRHLMSETSSESEKLKLGTTAINYGKRAAAIAPQNSDAQLSCAISYGKLIPLMSKKEQVTSSKLIKDGAEKAIKLDSHNDLAWHILGRWHRNVASMGTVTRALAAMIYEKLPSASIEEAVSCLEKSVKLNPHRVMNCIELGRTYAQVGRTQEAIRYIQKGLALPSEDKDDPAIKAEGRETLASIR